MKKLLLSASACALFVAPTNAAVLSFASDLGGEQHSPSVTTTAMGSAEISVDTSNETVDFMLSVTNISVDDLWDTLVANPVGPIHLHKAPAGSNGPVVVPFAFDMSTYGDTRIGFEVNVIGYSFADAIATSGSSETFANFVADLTAGNYYINVHTDAFNSGEIRGQVAAVPLPASLLLLLSGVGGLLGARRKATA
jgi:hypothetical protein